MRFEVRLVGVTLVMALLAPVADGYIHFPPMKLPELCKRSTCIRLLKIKKYDKEKGIFVFEVVELLKGEKPAIKSFRHVIRKDAVGVQPILDWVGDQKQAVMFSIEASGI